MRRDPDVSRALRGDMNEPERVALRQDIERRIATRERLTLPRQEERD